MSSKKKEYWQAPIEVFEDPTAVAPVVDTRRAAQLPFKPHTEMKVEDITNTVQWYDDVFEIVNSMTAHAKDAWAQGKVDDAVKITKLLMEFQRTATSALAARDSLVLTLTARGFLEGQKTQTLKEAIAAIKGMDK